MDHIKLQWHDREEDHLGRRKELHILINGQSLIDLVRPVELPFAELEGKPDIAGSYDWLCDVYCEIQQLKTEECILLGCHCGIPDCWPLTARVSMTEDIVCWSRFRNWHKAKGCASEWDYGALGPFVFDRQQYETAVRDLLPEIESGQLREQVIEKKLEVDYLARQKNDA
jgi:hypothetical protein